ncbi:MAG: hypothetical protein R3293_08780 [Candidatus Promineifilaceae bacterium]|nr:hypothetical protein [Candidatus Promineifilaceae bacterium]
MLSGIGYERDAGGGRIDAACRPLSVPSINVTIRSAALALFSGHNRDVGDIRLCISLAALNCSGGFKIFRVQKVNGFRQQTVTKYSN